MKKNENGKYRKHAEALEKARLRREGWLNRTMLSEGKGATSFMFLLRQDENGGYMDKPLQDIPKIELNVKINGEGTGQFD